MREPGCKRMDPKAQTYLPDTFQTQSQPMLMPAPEKCDNGEKHQAEVHSDPQTQCQPTHQLNLRGRTTESFHFPFDGFTVSLFKALFIFPLRYLFTIDLTPVFSFRWSLPPILGCIPKQPDSSKANLEWPVTPQTGLSPCAMCCSRQLRHR